MFFINKEKCVGCKVCIDTCPQGAISMENNKAVIDVNKCTECGRCYLVCPQSAISSELHSNQKISQNDDAQMFSISKVDPDSSMERGSGIRYGKRLGRSPWYGRGQGKNRGKRRRQ